jgi:hypothetical protein
LFHIIKEKLNMNKILICEVKLWDPIWVFWSCTIGVKNEWVILKWCGSNGTHKKLWSGLHHWRCS